MCIVHIIYRYPLKFPPRFSLLAQYAADRSLNLKFSIHIDDLKTVYPKSVKYVKNMSKRRFLKPRLYKQK